MPVSSLMASFQVAMRPWASVAITPMGSRAISSEVYTCMSSMVFCETRYPCTADRLSQPPRPTSSMARLSRTICICSRPRVWSNSAMSRPVTT